MFFKPNPEKLAKKGNVVGLLRLLRRSQRDPLRYKAEYYLGQRDLRQAAIPHLIRALSDPSLSADAATLLGKHGATEAVDGLVLALKNPDQQTRHAAVRALGKSDLKQAVVPRLIVALSDPSVSADAARLLGEHRATEAVDGLVSALKSSDQQTRRQAVAALSKMSSPKITYKDIQPLLDAAIGPELDIRRDAVRALHHCRDPRVFDAFCANVSDSEVAGVGWYAVVGLGELRDPRAVGPLTHALRTGPGIRWQHADDVFQAFRKIGNDAALAALLSFADVPSPSTKILDNIAAFEMEPATDFLLNHGHWGYLVRPKQRPLVLKNRDRCHRVAELLAKSIPKEKYPREESYEFLASIVQEQGAAVDEETLRTIVSLQPPKAGWADEGYEDVQAAADRARDEAYKRLLDAANTEVRRRRP